MFARHTLKILACAAAMAASPVAAATYAPSGMGTSFGGLVFEAHGLNGQRLISKTAASDLNSGVARGDPETNDFFIGEQGGFTAGLLGQLGGGFSSVSVRLTLFDGDNDPGNYDFNENFLRVNDVIFGNFSEVVTTTTDDEGNILNGLNDGIGFGDEETDTGTFTLADQPALATLFSSLLDTNTLSFEIDKRDDSGNFFDFSSRHRIPSGLSVDPTIAPVPLPAGGWLLLAGLGGLGLMRRRKSV